MSAIQPGRIAQIEKEKKETSVVKRAPMTMGDRGFDFSLDGAIRFAEGLIQSGMVPNGIKGPGAVVGLIEAGKELGLAPMYALANLTFTNGRLGVMGDCAKALIRKAGALKPGTDFSEQYEGEEQTPEWKCTVTAWRDGQPEPFSRSFSIAEAIAAKLVKLDGKKILSRAYGSFNDSGPWSTYTKRMLMYRALGFLARDYFSDVLGGAVLTEELRDYPQEPREDTTPPPEPDPLLAAAPASAEPVSAVEAEIVEESAASLRDKPEDRAGAKPEVESALPTPSEGPPKRAPQSGNEPSADEQQQIREIERLEGKIVSAGSLLDLDAVWAEAGPLLKKLSTDEQKRLNKLYRQNAKNFEKQER